MAKNKEHKLRKAATEEGNIIAKKKKKKKKKLNQVASSKSKTPISIGSLIKKARLAQKLTQEELALRCRTNKSYISRVESNSTDIRVSTLLKLVDGLEGKLKIKF